MPSVPMLARTLRPLFTEIADQTAREYRVIQRERVWRGASLLQTLVFGWMAKPEASLSELCQTAGSLGVRISPQGLDQRFTPALARWLEALVNRAISLVVAADPVAIPLLCRFTAVIVEDASVLPLPDALREHWPGCGGRTAATSRAALKLAVRLNLTTGHLEGPRLVPGRVHDRVAGEAHPPLAPGSLRIADGGYFGLARLRGLADQEVFYLSPVQAGTWVQAADGPAVPLQDLLAQQSGGTLDLAVHLGKAERLPTRLLAQRRSRTETRRRQRQIRKEAQREGETPSPARLALAGWTVLTTNVPAEQLTLREALVLFRARWQIELLFKRWKSRGRLDHWRTTKAIRSQCEVLAKLLALIVQHWLLLTGCWARPDRSLDRATAVIRTFAIPLATALHSGRGLHTWLRVIRDALAATPGINRRQAHPNTYQYLLDPALLALS